LQGVTSRFDWYLDRVVHFERSGTLTVNHDVVRATSDLGADCLVRHLQGCCHFYPNVFRPCHSTILLA